MPHRGTDPIWGMVGVQNYNLGGMVGARLGHGWSMVGKQLSFTEPKNRQMNRIS